ncbi:MAG: YIP1 family protein [Candidatus Neomarinimicrobiota bacterium]
MTNLKHLILEPSRLFLNLKEKPTWIVPFVIVAVAGIIIAILMQPAQAQVTVVKLQEMLSPDQIDAALQRAKRFGLITASIVPLVTLIRWAIVSGLILMLTNLFTEKLNFKQSLSIISYSNLIPLAGSAVNTAAIYIKGLETISSSYDLWLIGLNFWSREAIGMPLFLFLSEISVFSVWYLVLVVLGLNTIADLSRGKAAFVAVFTWLLGVAFRMGLALMGSQLAPGTAG